MKPYLIQKQSSLLKLGFDFLFFFFKKMQLKLKLKGSVGFMYLEGKI